MLSNNSLVFIIDILLCYLFAKHLTPYPFKVFASVL